jgi:uncharacterized protein with HEPN domain
MNSRDTQIIKKVLEEIAVIDNLIDGYDLNSFLADARTKMNDVWVTIVDDLPKFKKQLIDLQQASK